MSPDEYLEKVLDQQTFNDDDPELEDLRQRRNDIDKKLRSHFRNSSPSIRWAGSMAKGTMIIESYDGDMTCYFSRDEKEAGETLEEIHESVKTVLEEDYWVEVKASALRVREKNNYSNDFHIDVVPGRYVDDSNSDVFLHRTTNEKERLKTNLQTHIDHIRDSGFQDAIRLIKLWKIRNGIQSAKTFVLELLVVKLLQGEELEGISSQLKHVWAEFQNNADNLSIEDPANSNNSLKDALNSCRPFLSSAAQSTLSKINDKGWTEVFGEILEEEDVSEENRISGLTIAVNSVSIPTKPWSN